jgi:hypothetical protein
MESALSFIDARIAREAKTVENMVHIYCRKQHGAQSVLCNECGELLRYSLIRLEKCPFQEGKTTCANCPVHCYSLDMREKIREVMRFSGPRMILHHPIMALLHIKDGLLKKPIELNNTK